MLLLQWCFDAFGEYMRTKKSKEAKNVEVGLVVVFA